MPSFLPSLEQTKDHAVKVSQGLAEYQGTKGTLSMPNIGVTTLHSMSSYGSHSHSRRSSAGSSHSRRSSVGSLSSRKQNGKLGLSRKDIDNRHIYRKITDWFETWRPWQQKILLSGVTDRCSTSQLESLATTLEPVFHRDFVASLRKRYPSAPLRKGPLKSTQLGNKFRERLRNEFFRTSSASHPRQNQFNQISVVIRGPSTVGHRNTPSESSKKELESETQGDSMFVSSREASAERGSDTEGGGLPASDLALLRKIAVENEGDTTDGGEATDTDGERNSISKLADLADMLASDIIHNALDIAKAVDVYETKDVEQNNEREESASRLSQPRASSRSANRVKVVTLEDVKKYEGGDEQNESLTDLDKADVTKEGKTTHESEVKKAIEIPQLDLTESHTSNITVSNAQKSKSNSALVFVENESRAKDKCSNPPSTQSSSITHKSAVDKSLMDSNLSTVDFFSKQQWDRLGFMQKEVRTGALTHAYNIRDVDLPIQRSFKNVKWWLDSPSQGKEYVKARKSKLSQQFNNQLEKVWEWMKKWEDYERLTLIVEIIKMCNTDVVNYLAECLIDRLRDRTDINMLPDKVLMYIFSKLPAEQIQVCAKVSKRWRFLCSRDELWVVKCHDLGMQEGFPNITSMMLQTHEDLGIDWRMAFGELKRMISDMKGGIDPDKDNGEIFTPAGMVRLGAEFVPKPPKEHSSAGSSSSGSANLMKKRQRRQINAKYQRAGHSGRGSPQSDDDTEDLLLLDNYSQATSVEVVKKKKTRSSWSRSSRRSPTRKDQLLAKQAEDGKSELILDEDEEIVIRPLRRRKKKNSEEEEDDKALDVRPELCQARDLMGKSHSAHRLQWQRDELDLRHKQATYAGMVKGVSRVRKLQGHIHDVVCICFDKRRLISGSMDRTIRVWDVRSGHGLRKLYGHKGGVRCLQFHGDILVSGSWDTTAMIWDIVKFRRKAVLLGHTDAISCLQFNEQYLVTGSFDKTVRVWSMYAYYCRTVIRGHAGGVTCLQFQDDLVASGSTDRTIRLSNIHNGDCLRVYTGPQDPVNCLLIQGELLMCGTSLGHVFFWNKTTTDCEAAIEAHHTGVNALAFHEGRFFTASDDATIKEWDVFTMTCVRALHGHKGPVRDFKVSESRMASCSDDGNIRVWDTFTPRLNLSAGDFIPVGLINQRTT